MRARHVIQTKQLVAVVILCIMTTPSLTSSLTVNGSDTHPSQTGTIWAEVDHDYIRDDADPYDIQFRNATHGWALTQNRSSLGHGMILYSNDSGYSWYLQYYNETSFLHQIEIINEHLWVASRGGLLHSINDGGTWNFVPVGSDYDNFRFVHFFNETLGWAGSNLGIYQTEDGGDTWRTIMVWTFDDKPRRIHFTTPQNGWLIGAYKMYHSSDGGATWEVHHNKGGWTFSFISDTEAWAVGDNMLAHMTDGETWVEHILTSDTSSQAQYMTDVQFLNSTHGWIVGSRPRAAHTQNGGLQWLQQSVPVDRRINAVNFLNESLGWAITWGGHILRTERGNEVGTTSWSPADYTANYVVAAILIIAVGSVGLLLFMRKRRNSTHQSTLTTTDPMLE
ncbi:MAG: YCF48-related protein [Candidatus Thorarchaeota archaeon]